MFNYAVDLQAIKQSKNVIKAIWRRKRVKNFEILKGTTESIFVHSIQLSTYLFKCEHASLCTTSHSRLYISARTYYF